MNPKLSVWKEKAHDVKNERSKGAICADEENARVGKLVIQLEYSSRPPLGPAPIVGLFPLIKGGVLGTLQALPIG